MNYTPNTADWQIGDIVIHDADAKNESMLMQVVWTNADGRIRTKYVDKNIALSTFTNDKKLLHDPARFGIERGKHDQTLTIANLHGELEDCRDLIRQQQSDISRLIDTVESMRTHNKDKHATIQSLRNDLDEMVRTHTIPSDEWMAKMFRMD